MIYNFNERKELSEKVEKELAAMKEAYQKPEMNAAQLRKLQRKIEEAKRISRKESGRKKLVRTAAAAAAFIGAFVILPNTSASIANAMEQIPVFGNLVEVVTFRDYSYETERNTAYIEIPRIQLSHRTDREEVQDSLNKTTEQINQEIQRLSDELIEEFEAGLKDQEGYQDIIVKGEVLAQTSDYFTLKLMCYRGAGSGYAWNYYYTIDLNTGKRLSLKDVFREGADYITAVSENIKKQMQEQMAADASVTYWLNSDIEEWNFKTITEETSFYINQNGNLVIGFNEGDVAPMYMGTVEFVIPEEALEGLRK